MAERSRKVPSKASKIQWIVHRKDEMEEDVKRNKTFVRSHSMLVYLANHKHSVKGDKELDSKRILLHANDKTKPRTRTELPSSRILEITNDTESDAEYPASKSTLQSLPDTHRTPQSLVVSDSTNLLQLCNEQFDPFDALPVHYDGSINAVLQFYFTAIPDLLPSLANQAQNPLKSENWLWNIALLDSTAFYAFLQTTGFVRDMMQARGGMSLETVKFRVKCMNSVRAQLEDPDYRSSESCIAAISNLQAQSCMMGDFTQARLHMNALKKLIAERNGLHTINRRLAIIVAWAAAHLYAFEKARPDWELCIPLHNLHLPNSLTNLASLQTDSSLLVIPPHCDQSLRRMMLSLHTVALAAHSDWSAHVASDEFTDSVLAAQYDILEFNASQHEKAPTAKLNYEHRLLDILGIISQVFIFMVVRHLHLNCGTGIRFLARLKKGLGEDASFYAWASRSYPDLMIWICATAMESTLTPRGAEWKTWFQDKLQNILDMQEVDTQDKVRDVLGAFPATSNPGLTRAEMIWRELTTEESAVSQNLCHISQCPL